MRRRLYLPGTISPQRATKTIDGTPMRFTDSSRRDAQSQEKEQRKGLHHCRNKR